MQTRDDYNDIHDLFALEDIRKAMFDQFTSDELLLFAKTSTKMWDWVLQYVNAQLNPFARLQNRPDFSQAKRALALAVTFHAEPFIVQTILKHYPRIIHSVLETRQVTIHDPLTKQSFTAQWFFKLAHLLAAEGNLSGLDGLIRCFTDKPETWKEYRKLIKLLIEPVCWQSQNSKGRIGPNAPFIAILYQQDKFFGEIAFSGCPLIFSETRYDQPYEKLNPYYIALQQALTFNKPDFFQTIFHHYSRKAGSLMQPCIDFIMVEAMKENLVPLKLLLKMPSEGMDDLLMSYIPRLIEMNNLGLLKLISARVNLLSVSKLYGHSLLFTAAKKALDNDAFLPMVEFLLCCGFRPKKEENKLIKESLLASFHLIKNNKNKKIVSRYFNITEAFNTFILVCRKKDNNEKLQLYASFDFNPYTAGLKPEHYLQAVARAAGNKMNEFFNELVVSFFQNDEKVILNKRLARFVDRKRYLECLMRFVENGDGKWLTTGILEKIGDALVDLQSLSEADEKTAQEIVGMAIYFYKQMIGRQDASVECVTRVRKKMEYLSEKPLLACSK